MKEYQTEYIRMMQVSINYIEDNIKTKISLDTLADKANFSKFHYDRLFTSIVGESPIDYVRKRRLSMAADELIKTDKKITEIGQEFGFNSPETFTRTFKNVFKVTPSDYRQSHNRVPLYNKVDIARNMMSRLSDDGFAEPRLTRKEKFNVIGMECLIDVEADEKEQEIQRLWDVFIAEKVKIKNCALKDVMMGICMDSSYPNKFSYTACMEVQNLTDIPLGMSLKTIPSLDYAVFTHKGSVNKLSDTYDMIYRMWLPFSGYTLCSEIGDIEVYDDRFTMDEKSEIDIYLPIKSSK